MCDLTEKILIKSRFTASCEFLNVIIWKAALNDLVFAGQDFTVRIVNMETVCLDLFLSPLVNSEI